MKMWPPSSNILTASLSIIAVTICSSRVSASTKNEAKVNIRKSLTTPSVFDKLKSLNLLDDEEEESRTAISSVSNSQQNFRIDDALQYCFTKFNLSCLCYHSRKPDFSCIDLATRACWTTRDNCKVCEQQSICKDSSTCNVSCVCACTTASSGQNGLQKVACDQLCDEQSHCNQMSDKNHQLCQQRYVSKQFYEKCTHHAWHKANSQHKKVSKRRSNKPHARYGCPHSRRDKVAQFSVTAVTDSHSSTAHPPIFLSTLLTTFSQPTQTTLDPVICTMASSHLSTILTADGSILSLGSCSTQLSDTL